MPPRRIIRHCLIDRLFHWVFAVTVFVLLGTGLLPAFGVNFDWVPLHWMTGVLFVLLLLGHVLRSVTVKRPGIMWFRRGDFRRALPGKYTLAQKLMHNAVALLSLGAGVTGVMMMVRIDTPLWERNPFWLEATTWGYVYVVHGLVALCFVSAVMLHLYFSLRPEKRMYLRAMVLGWISPEEFRTCHDPALWKAEREEAH